MRRCWGCWAARLRLSWLPSAVVVAEHRRKQRLEDRYGRLARTRLLEQGDAALSFYQSVDSSATE